MNKNNNSIHDAVPLESGGVAARQGFSFQDHVAAGFLLDLLEENSLKEVWCESQDDVTLIWGGNKESVEFVQVKALTLDQLWSIAELCKNQKKQTVTGVKSTKSIIERSLEYDQYFETSRFRMVTTRPPNESLKPLLTPLNSAQRARAKDKLTAIKSGIRARLPSVVSINGNTTDYWVDNIVWDTRHDVVRVKQAGLLKLSELVESTGEFLANDQTNEFYTKLLWKAKKAAEMDFGERGEDKKFSEAKFRKWFDDTLRAASHPGRQQTAGTNLKKKLSAADLPAEVETAASLRRRYRESVLQPRYISNADRNYIEAEIEVVLLRLRSELDTDNLPDDGPSFHAKCLKAIESVKSELEKSRHLVEVPPDSWMIGFMYNLVDRCPHRFRKVSN